MKLSWRGVNLLFLVCTAVQFAGEGHITAFTPLILRDLGLTEAEIAVWTGLLFAIMTAMALPLAPFWGVLAERFSGKPVILRSFFLMSAALLVAAWAPDLGWLIAGRLLMGLSFGSVGVIVATQARITPRPKLGNAIATVQASIPIAASLGPPLGAAAVPVIGLRQLFVVDAACVLAAAIALVLLLPDPPGKPADQSVLARTREVIGLVWRLQPVRWNFISAFLLRGTTSVIDSYLPLRVAQLAEDPALAIGWILGIYGALTTVATWALGRFIDRIDEIKLYWRAMAFGTLLTAALAAAPWLWLVGVLAALRSIPVAFSSTLLFTHQARTVPVEHQTAIFGLAPVPRNLGGLIFPLLAASVAGLAPGAALGLGAVCYGITFLGGVRMGRVTRNLARAGGAETESQARRPG